jgi:hypothetical protein
VQDSHTDFSFLGENGFIPCNARGLCLRNMIMLSKIGSVLLQSFCNISLSCTLELYTNALSSWWKKVGIVKALSSSDCYAIWICCSCSHIFKLCHCFKEFTRHLCIMILICILVTRHVNIYSVFCLFICRPVFLRATNWSSLFFSVLFMFSLNKLTLSA